MSELEDQLAKVKEARANMGWPMVSTSSAPRVPRGRVTPPPRTPAPRYRPRPPAPPPRVDTSWAPAHMLVIRKIMRKYSIGMGDLRNTGKGRNKRIISIRWELYYLLKEDAGWSSTKTADFFGHNHTTVLYGITAYKRKNGL